MRPPEFTGGNTVMMLGACVQVSSRFNEAAGIHRRKPPTCPKTLRPRFTRFNEAAGIHRRKHV